MRRVAVQVVLRRQRVDEFSQHRGLTGARLTGQAEDAAVLLEVRKSCASLLHVETLEKQIRFDILGERQFFESIVTFDHWELPGSDFFIW